MWYCVYCVRWQQWVWRVWIRQLRRWWRRGGGQERDDRGCNGDQPDIPETDDLPDHPVRPRLRGGRPQVEQAEPEARSGAGALPHDHRLLRPAEVRAGESFNNPFNLLLVGLTRSSLVWWDKDSVKSISSTLSLSWRFLWTLTTQSTD